MDSLASVRPPELGMRIRYGRVALCISNLKGHTEAWEPVSPIEWATTKRGTSYLQLQGLHRSVGVRIPTRTAPQKLGGPYP